MQYQPVKQGLAPLMSWDIFCQKYNSLVEDATEYKQSVLAIKKIAKINKWSSGQIREALENIQRYVIVITDELQQISFTGKGFQQMTGYTFNEARGRNPNFLQGSATNKKNTRFVKEQLGQKESTEMVLENYRKNGELYLCKIIIKPIFNINRKLVNYIAFEQEIAA